jgi:integrase
MTAAGIEDGRLLRSVSKSGKINRDTLSDWAVWSIVEQSSKQIGIEHFGAHDLRRTCAKLCRKNGGDLEQIKFLLGHSSIQTTERYLGSEQDIEIAVNDNLGLYWKPRLLADFGDATIFTSRCYYANTLHGNKFGFSKDATRTPI